MVFDTNLSNNHGLWRNQYKYLTHLSNGIHHFNLPELHEGFLPSLLDYIKGGNSEMRQAAA